eukprot:gb/GECG01006915.1/.p1 GENE.gb/GECG01006915.1/~~gb/GECG01006915.1/.p1  ORF type:complete len:153 (+),score=14.67 gb/GECG01006915.1/:1-459(+)
MSRAGGMASGRIMRELRDIQNNPIDGIQIQPAESNAFFWYCSIRGAPGTVYEGEEFRLKVEFPSTYPMEPPLVVFLGKPPVHPHVYQNGHICLSILYDDWSPALKVASVLLSIVSMLSSAKKKELPSDHSLYMRSAPADPRKTRWDFHDDKV